MRVRRQPERGGEHNQQQIEQMGPVEQRAAAGAIARDDIFDGVPVQFVVQTHQTHVAVGVDETAREHIGQCLDAGGERDQQRQQAVRRQIPPAGAQRRVNWFAVERHSGR